MISVHFMYENGWKNDNNGMRHILICIIWHYDWFVKQKHSNIERTNNNIHLHNNLPQLISNSGLFSSAKTNLKQVKMFQDQLRFEKTNFHKMKTNLYGSCPNHPDCLLNSNTPFFLNRTVYQLFLYNYKIENCTLFN